MLPELDVVRLRHMLEAASEALEFARNRRRDDLDKDKMLGRAIVRDIEIVGEAASKVTTGTRISLDSIPWSSIVAMRNRLVHGYFDVDNDRVWDTITDDLPPLIAALEQALKSAGA